MHSKTGFKHAKHGSKNSSSIVSLRACCGCVVFLWFIGIGILVLKSADWSNYTSTGSDGKYHDIHDVKITSYKSPGSSEYRSQVLGLDYKLYSAKTEKKGGENNVYNPAVYRLQDLLEDWNPDDVSEEKWVMSRAHPDQKEGSHVRRFNHGCGEDMKLALQYRQAELPFIVYNVSSLDRAADTFSIDELLNNFGPMPRLGE